MTNRRKRLLFPGWAFREGQVLGITTPTIRAYNAVMDWYRYLPVAGKSVLLLVLKSIATSLLLSALTPFATAFYALRNGFRVPVEGVPYVTTAIAAWSFAGFLATVGVLLTVFYAASHAKVQFAVMERLPLRRFIRRRVAPIVYKNREIIAPFMRTEARFYIFCYVTGLFWLFCFFWMYDYLIHGRSGVASAGLRAFIVNSVMMIALLIHEGKLTFMKVQIFSSVVIVIGMAASLFTYDLYGSFLRMIRYGGGIEAELSVVSPSGVDKLAGYIMIQNDDTLVLMLNDRSTFLEIPADRIVRKTSTSYPKWAMPRDVSLSQQSRYLSFPM